MTVLRLLAFSIIILLYACSNNETITEPPDNGGPDSVRTVVPVVLAELPHDSGAFTQGLFVNDSLMYESTGLYGQSSIRILDAASAAPLASRSLDNQFFGEGLALLNNQLVQLTWLSNTAFIYDLLTLEPRGTFQYAGAGWGLTTDSSQFIMSNGSSSIVFRDSQFNIVREINVSLDGMFVSRLNELEYVHGKIYANVFQTDRILEIDPSSGAVTKIIDCAAIVAAENPPNNDAVLNGIAYLPQSNTFYLTGKLWRKIYQVSIPE